MQRKSMEYRIAALAGEILRLEETVSELLEALQTFAAISPKQWDSFMGDKGEAIHKARAAVAKATGG